MFLMEFIPAIKKKWWLADGLWHCFNHMIRWSLKSHWHTEENWVGNGWCCAAQEFCQLAKNFFLRLKCSVSHVAKPLLNTASVASRCWTTWVSTTVCTQKDEQMAAHGSSIAYQNLLSWVWFYNILYTNMQKVICILGHASQLVSGW
jgi:hypothetical protein